MNPKLLKRLDPIARRFGLYLSYGITDKEYVGKVVCPESYEISSWLKDNGYESIWFEAAKEHPETGQVHNMALRKVGVPEFEHVHDTGLGNYHYRQCQFHVHGFRVGDYMHLFSHYELRGDPKRIGSESTAEAIARMKAHYRPTYDRDDTDRSEWTYLRGVMCDDLEALVS